MKSMVKRNKKLIVYFSGLVAMLMGAGFTSPLYPHYIGTDTSIFLVMAKGIVSGKVPYIDLFDHKGPVFYWMEAFGYLLGGRTGVFIFQCLLFLVDLFLIEKISYLFQTSFPVVSAVFASAFFYLFSHGNLTEEFSMPFVLIALYLQLRFLLSGEKKHSFLAGFFYGIILCLLAFIRLNNAVIPCCLILCIAVFLMMDREWINLLGNLLMGFLGISVVALPVCLYFYRRGALYDMLYGTFLHNLLYAKNIAHYPLLSGAFPHFLFLFLPGAAALFVFWNKWREEKNRAYLSLGLTVILTYGMLAYTNVYIHYFLLGVPLFTVAAAVMDREVSVPLIWKEMAAFVLARKNKDQFFSKGESIFLSAVAAMYLAVSLLSACAPIYKTYLSDISYSEYAEVQDGLSLIPEEERDSVIVYNVMSKFYYFADILPCFRYFALQKWVSTDKVNVNQEFMQFLRTEHPLWVVIYAGEEDETLREILASAYSLRGSDGFLSYYRYEDGKSR